MTFGWCHEENGIERTSRNESHDFNGYVRVTDNLPRMNQALNQPYEEGGSSNDPNVGVQSIRTPLASNSDALTAIRRFLEETGVLSPGELAMSLAEMGAFVRGLLLR